MWSLVPRCLGLIGLLVGLIAAARAQPADEGLPASLPAETLRAAGRLASRFAAVQKMVDAKQWPEAIEEYQQILDESGDELVQLGPRHFVPARRLCHLRLAALPANARKLYRARVDEPARKLFEQGKAQRDPRLLRRVVDDFFCSRHTDKVLDLLGDLAFERGQFEVALRWWRMLARPAADLPEKEKDKDRSPKFDDLIYPDPQVDVAQVRAKQVLALLFAGQPESSKSELQSLRQSHPKAEGHLAGRNGVYADILKQTIDQYQPGSPTFNRSWLTFAGDPSRTFVAPKAPRLHELDYPARPIRLDGQAERPAAEPGKVLTPTAQARRLAFHPVVFGGQVVVADARFITGYDLLTRRRTFRCDLAQHVKDGGFDQLDLRLPSPLDVRYTLTVADDRIYVRMGTQTLAPGLVERSGSYLVCLALDREQGYRLVWQTKPPVWPKETSVFEGSPVVHDGRAYIAVTRFSGRTAITAIVCYDADSGALRWQQDVSEQDSKDDDYRTRHDLLTLAGSNVVHCSHAGAAVAVDAVTGKRAWAVRYPSRGRRTDDGDPSPRDLAPCIAAAGRIYAAPADLDRILCLDAGSGQLVWESKSIEVLHLLGVAGNKLIFTTANQPRGIRALEADTGNDLRHWLQPDSGDDWPTFGRGFLAGDRVYWPTWYGLVILDLETGQAVRHERNDRLRKSPDNPKLGNLVFGHGCIVVADEDELWWHVPESLRLEQRKKEAAANPGSAAAFLRLALAEAGNGLFADALTHFARAEQLARPEEKWDDWRLRDWARRQRQGILFELAERSRTSKRWDEAAKHLQQAAATDFTIPERLQALVKLTELWIATEQPAKAVAVAQAILADDFLREGQFLDADEIPRRAASWVRSQVDGWIAHHGAGIYRPFEEAANKLLASATGDRREAVLKQVASLYPNSNAAYAARWNLVPKPAPAASETLPALRPSLGRSWTITLASAERLLVPEGPSGRDLLFFWQAGQIVCRDGLKAEISWRHKPNDDVQWLGIHENTLITADERTVQGLWLSDGRVAWSFQAPALRPSGSNGLTGFRLVQPLYHVPELVRFCSLQGGVRLWVIDPVTGEVVSTCWSPSSQLLPGLGPGRFSPNYASHHFIPGSRVCNATADQQIICFQVPFFARGNPFPTPSARELWAYRPDTSRLPSLSPEPLCVLVRNETTTPRPKHLVVRVPTNYGCGLEAINLGTGGEVWDRPLIFSGARLPDLKRAALLNDRLCLVTGNTLEAVALADAKRLWQVPLPAAETDWHAVHAGHCLVVYPHRTQYDQDVPRIWQRFGKQVATRFWRSLRPVPSARECKELAAALELAREKNKFPVLLFDPKDGKLLQRLEFPNAGARQQVQVMRDKLIVVAGQKAYGFKSK